MTDDSRIILLNGAGNGGKPKKLRGGDLINVNQAMNMVLNACGPIAALAEEIKARQIALEDHVGFTYTPPPEEPEEVRAWRTATGTADLAPRGEGGDSEC